MSAIEFAINPTKRNKQDEERTRPKKGGSRGRWRFEVLLFAVLRRHYSRVNSFETQVDVEGLRHISVLGHGINCQLTPQISRVFVGTFGFAWCRGWGRRRRWRRRWWGRCWGVRVVATGRSIFLLNWAIWFLARVACSIKSNKAGRRTKAHGNHHNRVNLNVEF